MPDPLSIALKQLATKGLQVTPQTEAALRRALAKYNGQISDDALKQLLQKFLDGIKTIAKPRIEDRSGTAVEVGQTQTSLRADILQLLQKFNSPEGIAEALNIDFKIRTATEVVRGAGRFLLGQTDVDEYPAWELYRLYDRKVPRLWRGDEGTNDPSLGAAFASRWYAAAQAAGDADAARILQDEGRMIALKESEIWQQLGEFDDGLGNPYPPFAFNSGMEVDGVPRKECIELGLLDEDGNTKDGDAPEGSDFDFATLLGIKEAA